jgi:hypothetical protein
VRPTLDLPSRQDLRVFGGYCVAAAVYIAVGVTYLDFMLSVVVGMAYLLVAVWLVPLAFRRLRR